MVFFFNDTATTEIYTYRHTLSLHDALPILEVAAGIAAIGALDLDHARAEITEPQRARRAGEELAEIEHRHTGERHDETAVGRAVLLDHGPARSAPQLVCLYDISFQELCCPLGDEATGIGRGRAACRATGKSAVG